MEWNARTEWNEMESRENDMKRIHCSYTHKR
jgi:hypothetical protein